MDPTMQAATNFEPLKTATPFQPPRDRQAWAPFLASSAGGWLVISHATQPSPEASLLAIAMLAFFLASEWLTNLFGRSRGGIVQPSRLADPTGIALLVIIALSLTAFLYRLDPAARQAWGTVLTGVTAAVALMFLLRREWVPLDRRLLLLTHFLLTLPCLLFAFLQWGVGAPLAWKLWAPPALFFPSLALTGYVWLEGDHTERSSSTLAVTPLLGAVVLAAYQGAWILATLLAAWGIRATYLLATRQANGRGLPPMGRIRMFVFESELWATGVTLVWLAHAWGLS